MALIEVIPAHFINADGHLGFYLGIDTLIDLAVGQKLVDEECCCMAVIEDQGMAQGYGLGEPATIIGNTVVKAVIEIKGLAEIRKNLRALCLNGAAI